MSWEKEIREKLKMLKITTIRSQKSSTIIDKNDISLVKILFHLIKIYQLFHVSPLAERLDKHAKTVTEQSEKKKENSNFPLQNGKDFEDYVLTKYIESE